uniref:SH3 domain-containing protein n=1 Tax=Strigamia maritima TaxID=126957 RepID=T1JHQ5_STRMM
MNLDKDQSHVPNIGRITGSSSIETLVRVGIEKENGFGPDSKMVVLYDFTPCVDDELEVKRGQGVNVLYQENDWVYVIAESGQEGFIPHSYCVPCSIDSSQRQKKLPRGDSADDLDQNSSRDTQSLHSAGHLSDSETFVLQTSNNKSKTNDENSLSSQFSTPDVYPFFKDPAGRYIVLYTFIARDENDVSVERGEFVTVLNREDPDWFWIVRSDGQEGFVPSAFVYPAEIIQDRVATSVNESNPEQIPGDSAIRGTTSTVQDPHLHGSEMVMLYDYKAQAPDDLSVRRGDWIYADLSNQTVEGWLWAFAPKTRKYGFIPKAYARPPAMTSL